jgi:hypothetical protein
MREYPWAAGYNRGEGGLDMLGNGGKYNSEISMQNARKVSRVLFLFQTAVARYLCIAGDRSWPILS